MTWDANLFLPQTLAAGALTEFTLLTDAALATTSLGRGTVGMIYGRMTAGIPESETQLDAVGFAWGIRLKESDAAAVAGTTYSPLGDADSTDWIHWRAGSVLKESGAGTSGAGAPTTWVDESFVVNNPRTIKQDQELVMLIESLGTSTAVLNVMFWCRVLIILP